jgi:hypothetical protein
MQLLRMPKTVCWILTCAVIFLLVMSGYRLGLSWFFNYFSISKAEINTTFWTGFRFDARIIGGFSLLMLLLSFWPGMHFFKTSLGRNTALCFYGLFTLILTLVYTADAVSVFVLKTRLTGTLISDLVKNTQNGVLFKTGAPWFLITLIVILFVFFLFLVFKTLHGRISKKKSAYSDTKYPRVTWQIAMILMCAIGVYGTVNMRPLTANSFVTKVSPQSFQLAINPLESFIYTMPKIEL